MCVPALAALATPAAAATIATAALVIQGVSAVGQAAAAVDVAKKQNQAVVENTRSAKDAYFLKTVQSNLRLRQEQSQALNQQMDADIKMQKAQATALAAASGAGVQGVNVDQLINDFERSEGIYNSRVDERLEQIAAQTEMTNLGYQSEAISRINSQQPVSYAETLFGVAAPLADFGLSYFDTTARYAALDFD
jgi:hypothetical protein